MYYTAWKQIVSFKIIAAVYFYISAYSYVIENKKCNSKLFEKKKLKKCTLRKYHMDLFITCPCTRLLRHGGIDRPFSCNIIWTCLTLAIALGYSITVALIGLSLVISYGPAYHLPLH